MPHSIVIKVKKIGQEVRLLILALETLLKAPIIFILAATSHFRKITSIEKAPQKQKSANP